ncbi:MAG: hypothetical protein ACYC0L_05610 [Thermoleophilia bacterium]
MSNQKRSFEEDRQILQAARAVLIDYLGQDHTGNFPAVSGSLMGAIRAMDEWIGICGRGEYLAEAKRP